MKVTIDLTLFIENDLNANEFFTLLALQSPLETFLEYVEKRGTLPKAMLDRLVEKGFVSVNDTNPDLFSDAIYLLTPKSIELFEKLKESGVNVTENTTLVPDKTILDDLKKHYPKKTRCGRVLQANVNAKTSEKYLKKYLLGLKESGATHEDVLKAIEAEKHTRQGINDKYWSMLSTYIESAMWSGYLGKEMGEPVVQLGHMQAI